MKKLITIVLIFMLLSGQAPFMSVYHLAHIIEGEAGNNSYDKDYGICPVEAKIAVAYMVSRDGVFYGWKTPNKESKYIAETWLFYPDYSHGASHWFDSEDLKTQRVEDITENLELIGKIPCKHTVIHLFK